MNGIQGLNKGERTQEMEEEGVVTFKTVSIGTLALPMQRVPPTRPQQVPREAYMFSILAIQASPSSDMYPLFSCPLLA